MRSPQSVRLLWLALAAEVLFGVACLILSRNPVSLVVIFTIFGFVAALGYGARYFGVWSGDWSDRPDGREDIRVNTNPDSVNLMSERNSGSWNLSNVSFNLGSYPERIEVIEQVLPLEEAITGLRINLTSGALVLTGQEELQEIRLKGIRRVWARDEIAARVELDRLQIRPWRENNVLNIEAGDPAQGFVVGRGPRLDLEVLVPAALAASLSANQGDLTIRRYNGELQAKTTVGAITIEAYNSGRDIRLNTTTGRISLHNVAAGMIRAHSGAGAFDLAGIGAEALELDTTAGQVRVRGINCGRLAASATTGSLELYEAGIDGGLELKTGAGRIVVANSRAAFFRLEAATGQISYQGAVPVGPSEVNSGVGSSSLTFAPGAGFQLDARSNIGTVETYLPVSRLEYQNRNTFQGQVAGGGAPVKITSQVGSVRVTVK